MCFDIHFRHVSVAIQNDARYVTAAGRSRPNARQEDEVTDLFGVRISADRFWRIFGLYRLMILNLFFGHNDILAGYVFALDRSDLRFAGQFDCSQLTAPNTARVD